MADSPSLTAWLLRLAPRRFSRDKGQKFAWGIGSTGDVILDAVTMAVNCRFPSSAPEDALPRISRDRRLPRGPGESTESFRARLKAAFTAWQWAGTEFGMLGQLKAYGLSNSDIVENYEWDDPWPHDTDNWSRFWVVIPEGGHPWSGSIPADDQTALRRLIRAWKPANAICVEVIALTSGRLLDWPNDGTTLDDLDVAGFTLDDSSALRFSW